ncbi:MAG: hypothetical protein J6M02_02490 [Clostridia bacterium]|nr:hypothetical protein [Clostridia bacterium]
MKKYFFSITIFIIAVFCIVFPQDMIAATKSGLTLWYNVIVPSLLPFLILSDLITKSALPYLFGKLFAPVMKILFHLPGVSSIAVFLGMTGGYPIGAKTTADLLKNNAISQNAANHLITFVNNSGPLFILGAIGIGLYQNTTIGLLLLLSHYLAAFFTGFLFRFFKKETESQTTASSPIRFEVIRLSKLSGILTETIKHSIQLICVIGGFILTFSIFSAILEKTGILLLLSKILFPKIETQTSYSILTGLLEVTNGVNKVATLSIPLLYKLIITSMLVSFAGFSIHMQTLSVLSDTNISFLRYLTGKIIQSLFSGMITWLFLWKTNFSTLLTTSVVATTPAYTESEINLILSVILTLLLFSSIFKIFQIHFLQKKKNPPY